MHQPAPENEADASNHVNRRRRSVVMTLLLVCFAVGGGLEDPVTLAGNFTQQGQSLFQQGRYEPALEAFREAYAQQPSAVLLFDMGSCAMELGHYQQALAY